MNLDRVSHNGMINTDLSDLVMRLVFPTLWSPRRTTFVRLGDVKEKSAVAGVDGESIGGI
jgi:hypothetical protein